MKGTDRESPRRVRLAVIVSEKRAKEQYGSLYRCSWFHRCIVIYANILWGAHSNDYNMAYWVGKAQMFTPSHGRVVYGDNHDSMIY